MMNKKGSGLQIMFLWIFIIIAMFLVGTVYLVMAEPFQVIEENFTPNLSTDDMVVWNSINGLWQDWPLIYLIGLFVAGTIGTIILSARQDTYYQ